MRKSALRFVCVAVAFCAALAVVAPAFAVDLGPVPNHAIVGSADLFGMTEADARAAISREASLTPLPKIRAQSAGFVFYLDARRCAVLDVNRMLAKAYEPSAETTFTIPRMANITTSTVTSFVTTAAKKVYRSRHNAYYYVNRYHHLKWRKAVYGRALYQGIAKSLLISALRKEIVSGAVQPTVNMPYKTYTPSITNSKLGRAILVDLSQRRLRLYDHSDLLKKVGVAVGMRAYPTPRGKFKIIAKVKHPSWYNPGSAWAANMPSYIGPGPTNPLGLRALYLNSPGIRIHGTYKTGTIGTAASHGCIRVANSKIVKLYPMVPVGTRVFIIR